MYVVHIIGGRSTTFKYYEDALDCVRQCTAIGLVAYIG